MSRRAHFPDEEPEIEFISKGYDLTSGSCGQCGQDGHSSAACPSRPLSSWGVAK